MEDNSVYIGNFENGLKQGKGKLVYPSGNTFVGEWKFNKKNGEGTMEWIDCKEKYQGNWSDDVPNGVGNLIWLETNNTIRLLKNRYSGEFQSGVREGLGVFYYSDGSMYEGQWKGNKKHGYAVFTDEKGVSVYGYYENDRLKRQLFLFDIIYDQFGNSIKYGDSNRFSHNNYEF